MKYWEVFKELEARPDRTFRTTYDGWTFEIKNVNGWFKFNVIDVDGNKRNHLMPTGAFNDNAEVDLDWHLVHEPVTLQEAIQAWGAGKIVSVEVDGCKFKQTHDDSILVLSERMINLGTWYVED